ncbi:hypothetical protein [Fuerstiella marisgermanici]|uniref:Uncharacterized protein n=1 Tax=Fuerstiella marisgermanici TaxID=1891926 RepID=A0A1P8WQ20_9PLAN|nr:hypothetical protein [Fuerstiella marisgermanici]APZ96146.1 hypothetical protein Fuma_05814 [Fuerstiella marisgermanici]
MKNLNNLDDFDLTVAGGVSLPADMRDVRVDTVQLPDTDIGRQISLLLQLHPQICSQFRTGDTADMDLATQQLLLDDLRDALDIPTLKPAAV